MLYSSRMMFKSHSNIIRERGKRVKVIDLVRERAEQMLKPLDALKRS